MTNIYMGSLKSTLVLVKTQALVPALRWLPGKGKCGLEGTIPSSLTCTWAPPAQGQRREMRLHEQVLVSPPAFSGPHPHSSTTKRSKAVISKLREGCHLCRLLFNTLITSTCKQVRKSRVTVRGHKPLPFSLTCQPGPSTAAHQQTPQNQTASANDPE